ncbi:hypothetical protein [Mesorhizobium sp. CO1-1-8]|uniref:hypothetical protein n=1 Tax=Mesorhizobium sp. CO1-1-8 TaxID=2876631 RepID=UPI001CD10C3E|nr:hypothetical protein [Mesorhizobium sp. CO1-1-8]MBZ9775245.1 hypothetical protein [Mesorhizobium sp. CO1-1-8]
MRASQSRSMALAALEVLSDGEARVLFDTSTHPEWNVPNVISVNDASAAKYPDLVKRLLKVDIEISRWADAHPDETIKTFVKATKSSEKSVRKTYADGVFHQDPKLTDDAVAAFAGRGEIHGQRWAPEGLDRLWQMARQELCRWRCG